ncbi:MAG: class I SAM-dependent methyltransferase, partial [Myxococcales bacterium]
MRGLEQIPSLYDACMAFADWRGLRRWRRWLAAGARGRTLEIGCGTGRNLPLYGQPVSVVGIEPEWDALLAARRKAPGVPLVQARAEALPFKPGVFDTVVSSLVFCSVSDVPGALGEIRRVLAPGGELRMLEHVRARSRMGAWLQDRIQP